MALGCCIIEYFVVLFDEVGFENFIFCKLVEWIYFIEVLIY